MKKCRRNLMMLFLTVGVLFTCSCSSGPDPDQGQKAFIFQEPVPSVSLAFNEFVASAEKGGSFTLPNGTEIYFPGNALEYEEGGDVKGEVTLKYREFHDAGDIFLVGIPMEYGKNDQLQTAGMFEIRCEQNGRPLKLKDEKEAKVTMASFVNDNCYSQFKFNEKEAQWEMTGNDHVVNNPLYDSLVRALKSLDPGLKIPLGSRYFAFNFYGFVDVYKENISSVTDKSILNSKAREYGVRWPGFTNGNTIKFRGQYIPAPFILWKNLTSADFPSWAEDSYSDIQKINSWKYKLVLYKIGNPDQRFTTYISPVMPLKQLMKKSALQRRKEYESALEEKKRIEEHLEMVSEIRREFPVSGFGLYNWDRIMKKSDKVMVNAVFDFDTVTEQSVEIVQVVGNNRSISRTSYTAGENSNIILTAEPDAFIFAVLPGNTVALFDTLDYRKIDILKLKDQENPTYTFKMKTLGKFENSAQLKEMLGLTRKSS